MQIAQRQFELAGHSILVTGAAQGIGHGISETFLEWGAQVSLADLDADKVAQSSRNLSAHYGEHVAGIGMDVTDEASVATGLDESWSRFGKLDLVVNCAGILTYSKVAEMTLAAWERTLRINSTGVFLVSRRFVQRLQQEKRQGSIVSLSSIAGKRGDPGLAHYSASKFAVIGFTQALAREVGDDDITVNAICPGVVRTAMIDTLARKTGTSSDAWIEQQAIKRAQTPRDIAFAAAFLHLSRAVTGQSLVVDGGSVFS